MNHPTEKLKELIENAALAIKRIADNHPYRSNGASWESYMAQCGYTASSSVRMTSEGQSMERWQEELVDFITARAGFEINRKFRPVSWHGLGLIDRVLWDALNDPIVATWRFMQSQQLELA